MDHPDAIIIGAGPAGPATAASLRRQGVEAERIARTAKDLLRLGRFIR
jgi:2-polyprenyl-6-methoxyphenol hydroxylase-like FAD-dependent oxidoreductase